MFRNQHHRCICIWIWIWTDARLDSLSGQHVRRREAMRVVCAIAICLCICRRLRLRLCQPFLPCIIFIFFLYATAGWLAVSKNIKSTSVAYIGTCKVSANLSAMSFVVSPQSAYHTNRRIGIRIRSRNGGNRSVALPTATMSQDCYCISSAKIQWLTL